MASFLTLFKMKNEVIEPDWVRRTHDDVLRRFGLNRALENDFSEGHAHRAIHSIFDDGSCRICVCLGSCNLSISRMGRNQLQFKQLC